MQEKLNLQKRIVKVSNPQYTVVRTVIIYASDDSITRFLLTHQAKEIIHDAPDIIFSAN